MAAETPKMETPGSLQDLLTGMVQMNASDLHVKVGSPPIMRLNRDLVPFGSRVLTQQDVQAFVAQIMSQRQKDQFQQDQEVDFSYTVSGLGRFRTNVFVQRGSMGIVFRFVKTEIPNFDKLGLPPSLAQFASQERGVIIVSGATNTGKSTTIAAMVNYINRNFRRHIVTVEDPIEYLHQDRLSIINQREVGIDTMSFNRALRHILRQDPDVIVIGEMRDADSFNAALQASETGHLVLTTLHASSAAHSVDRILDFFGDPELRDQARFQIANNLVAVVSQRLLPLKNNEGLAPAIEIMTGGPMVKKLIHENQLKKLPQAIAGGQDSEMVSFNQSILKLIQAGKVSEEVGLAYSSNPEALRMNLQGIFLDEGRKIMN